jgi:hypothetical protein
MTYSRSPLLTQEYYDCLVAELLSFRLDLGGAKEAAEPRRPQPESGLAAERVPPSPASRVAFAHPAIAAGQLPLGPTTVRLDYGENALPSPRLVEVSLFEAFARRDLGTAEADPAPEVAELLRRRFGLGGGPAGRVPRIVLGLGVASLFAALAEACSAERGTFVFSSGGYGLFVAAVELHASLGPRTDRAGDEPGSAPRRSTASRAPVPGSSQPLVVNPTGSPTSARDRGPPCRRRAPPRSGRGRYPLSGLSSTASSPGADAALQKHAVDLVLLGGLSKEVAGLAPVFYAGCHRERERACGAAGLPSRTDDDLAAR